MNWRKIHVRFREISPIDGETFPPSGNSVENRERTIPSTIRDALERDEEATGKPSQARIRYQTAVDRADEIRMTGLYRVRSERLEFIGSASGDAKRLGEAKNATIRFEEQRAIEQVRQQVSGLAVDRAITDSRIRLKSSESLHSHIIDHRIGPLIGERH